MSDLHLLLAIADDTASLGSQILAQYVDQATLVEQLGMQVSQFDEEERDEEER